MKNILIILTLFLFSCNESVTISKEEYNKLKGDTFKPEYPKHITIYTGVNKNYNNLEGDIYLSSDGHEYLITNIGVHSQTVGHYIECKKCKRDTL